MESGLGRLACKVREEQIVEDVGDGKRLPDEMNGHAPRDRQRVRALAPRHRRQDGIMESDAAIGVAALDGAFARREPFHPGWVMMGRHLPQSTVAICAAPQRASTRSKTSKTSGHQ